jgi:Raf kinase inhibitor-like YbhB/YbcL family protein
MTEQAQIDSEASHRVMPMKLLSLAFEDGGHLPARHTADGADLSPPLRWGNPPRDAQSLALICHDPDAPKRPFVHWLAWNISPQRTHLVEGVSPTSDDEGICQGQNGFGKHGYAGPKPPPGPPHRYVFHLYALDTKLDLPRDATREQLEQAMDGHILGEGEVIGRYGRSQ